MYAIHTSVLIVLIRAVPNHTIEHHVTAAVSNNLRTDTWCDNLFPGMAP